MSITKEIFTSDFRLLLTFGRRSCIILQVQKLSGISLKFIVLTQLTPSYTRALEERQDYTLYRKVEEVAAHT